MVSLWVLMARAYPFPAMICCAALLPKRSHAIHSSLKPDSLMCRPIAPRKFNLFCVGRTQETLPPTSDAAKFHIMRSHYQASVWNQAHSPYPDLPPVTEMGWMHLDGRLVSRLLSLPPIPKACTDITSCGCMKGVPHPTLQLQENLRRTTAGNLATTVVTVMTTRNKFM